MTPDQDAFRCFAGAVERRSGAELARASMTDEGDVVVRYYRAVPGASGVEVFVDATRDKFGSSRWLQARCTGFDASSGQATGCEPNGTGRI